MFKFFKQDVAPAALLIAMFFATNAQAAVPQSFNYQGRLKKDAKAVSDWKWFEFRLTNENGSTQYWTSGSTRIYVTNGMFRYTLGPIEGLDWGAAAVEPYIEVKVGDSSPDILLLPRERLVSSPYAIYAASATYSLASGTAAFAQNSVALASRAFDAFVSTRAENQTVGGVKTFTSTAVFQQTVAVGQNVITQSSVTAPSISASTIIATGEITSGAGFYQYRTGANAYDYDVKVAPSGWVMIDLSTKVPVGTKAVHISCDFNWGTGSGDTTISFRKYGETGSYNQTAGRVLVDNRMHNTDAIVAVDENRRIEWSATAGTWLYRVFLIKGWWK